MKFNSLLVLLLTFSLTAQAQLSRAPRRQRASMKVVATAAADTSTAATDRRDGQTLPIRRVILYSNGVAYVERRGAVSGHAEVNLSFKQSQVDDVLKSMVVLDLGEGRIGAVSYNSSAPPSARMADIPFSIGASSGGGTSGGLAGVLTQLQGARVAVTTAANRTVIGSVLTVEERRMQPAPDKPSVVTRALVIAANGGELMSFDLDEVRAVKLVDEGARRDVSEFADASASARRRDAKTITVTSDGASRREMLVSYTVAAPIWKTTYRVVLDPEGKPFFQGWAIVDNVSEEDWDDVRLSLISGTPISFIQPIQKPFYRYRPVIPMPSDLRLTPQVHEPETGESVGAAGSINGVITDPAGGRVAGASVTITNAADGRQYNATTNEAGVFSTPALSPGNYSVSISAPGFSQTVVRNVSVNTGRAANINVNISAAGVSETVEISAADVISLDDEDTPPAAPVHGKSLMQVSPTLGAAIVSGRSGVEVAAEGSEVGDLFEYQIAQPVTVKRDRSALIPIIQTRMEGERVSVYNEATHRTRPMSGLLLKNTTALTFEDGALTVIDGDAYAGEALMERLKPGEERLGSFALDLGTLITPRVEIDRAPTHFVTIAHGVLQAHFYRREKKVYTLTNQTDRKRTVFVEHPVRDDRELDDKETPRPEGKTARFYRFRVELAPGETEHLPVVERMEQRESYQLSSLNPQTLHFFFTSRYIDEQTRAALQNIIELRGRVAAAEARIAAIDKELREIGDDQKRLRENIEALTKTAEAKQLIARYVAKADQQETRIEQLTKEKQAAVEERQRLQSQLEAAVRALTLERHLAMEPSASEARP